MRPLAISSAFLILLAACVSAPAPESAAAPPTACDTPAHHAFDFWIGEWDVFAPDGSKAGENSIQTAEYGCLLVERWTDSSGITGQSYNFLDPATDKWRQVWVSGGVVIDYAGKLDEHGAMRLEGKNTYRKGAPPQGFRGAWTPNADGTVTQHFEQADAEGNWSDWFVGTYVRKPAN